MARLDAVLTIALALVAPTAVWTFHVVAPAHPSCLLESRGTTLRSSHFHSTTQQTSPWTRLSATADNSAAVDEKEQQLESLFEEGSDVDGFMTQAEFQALDPIQEMLEDGDLLESELKDIWSKYNNNEDRIRFDAFAQIYQAIDDLFEDDEDDEDDTPIKTTEPPVVSSEDTTLMNDEEARAELETIFQVISTEGYLSKEGLRNWDEIETLIVDGMLGEEEFEELWQKVGSNTRDEKLDFAAFMAFNSNLDSLFDFDEELDEADAVDASETEEEAEDPQSAESSLFVSIAGASGVVTVENMLSSWDELKEMIEDGDILMEEVEQIYADSLSKSKSSDGLDETGFEAMQASVDDLFEDDGDDEEETQQPADVPAPEATPAGPSEFKTDLLRALDVISTTSEEEERLACGLESTEREDKLVLNLVGQLLEDGQRDNLLFQKQGGIQPSDVAGNWQLLYTTSSAMKFNQGLSGIGGSFPNGKFGGLTQSLSSSKFLADVEYKERVEVTPSSASFDVTVDGNWELRKSVSLFTGAPSIVLAVEPARVMYGPTSTKADHWKSLGPTNILDLVYLDEDLRIMRGSTSVDTILIFQRI